MPKRTPRPNNRPLKRCRYCKGKFQPRREDQAFCSPTHRKLYWKYGALPFDKLIARVEKTLREMIHNETAGLRSELDTVRRLVENVVAAWPKRPDHA